MDDIPVNKKSSVKKSSKSEEETSEPIYIIMLGELYEGLDGVVSDDSRANIVEYLKQRIEGISDPVRREGTIRKIAERLGDDDYWVDYASKLA